MDFHAHLSGVEVIGLLGGHWDPAARRLIISHAFPCRPAQAPPHPHLFKSAHSVHVCDLTTATKPPPKCSDRLLCQQERSMLFAWLPLGYYDSAEVAGPWSVHGTDEDYNFLLFAAEVGFQQAAWHPPVSEWYVSEM